MTSLASETLAARAVNDYRRRDVLGYLGLRYYLENAASRSDLWAQKVATSLVLSRSGPLYLSVEHFKEYSPAGVIEHRSLFIPTPNECVAEASLLAECARQRKVFSNPDWVFSYNLAKAENREGAFTVYSDGLRRRQKAIAFECKSSRKFVVRYTDIKKFYPSISAEMAKRAWLKYAGEASLERKFTDLGCVLIEGHSLSGSAVLTGPMFSHLLANLVLRELDIKMRVRLPTSYFRYVDDIVLVGEPRSVRNSIEILRTEMEEIGLSLHDDLSPKNLVVTREEWLLSQDDFSDNGRVSWMRLVRNLKWWMMNHPKGEFLLEKAFGELGMRIPILHYRNEARQKTFMRKMRDFSRGLLKWRYIGFPPTLHDIVWLASKLRKRYEDEFFQLIVDLADLVGFERKRRISKLRYCVARLIYLSSDSQLIKIADAASPLFEMYFHVEIARAVATGRIDRILAMGTNAAQAAAQPLKTARKIVTAKRAGNGRAQEQSLAVMLMNGLELQFLDEKPRETELIRFAANGADQELMNSGDRFLREMACLHGLQPKPIHSRMLDIVFDRDEEYPFDALISPWSLS